MKKNMFAILILTLICISVFSYGCKKKENPVAPVVSTGSLTGYASLYYYSGTANPIKSGIQVSVVEKNSSATTDSTGKWIITGIPEGTYTISYYKNGYGTWKVFNYKFTGTGTDTLSAVPLYQTPSYYLYNVEKMVTSSAPNSIDLIGSFNGTPPSGARYVRLFIGTTVKVSNNPANYTFSTLITLPSSASSLTCNLTAAVFNKNGISSGQQAFIVAYPESTVSTSYTDPATGRLWYANINTKSSNILEVTAP